MHCEYFLKINLLNFENLRCNCSTADGESFACLDCYIGLILECKCLADIYGLSWINLCHELVYSSVVFCEDRSFQGLSILCCLEIDIYHGAGR